MTRAEKTPFDLLPSARSALGAQAVVEGPVTGRRDPSRRAQACSSGARKYDPAGCHPGSAAGALASVGTVGDSYDNALAESTIGQLKAELVYRRGPGPTIEQLEFALFEYLDWWNHRRLHRRWPDPSGDGRTARAASWPQT
jgi:transposase InsO family protein